MERVALKPFLKWVGGKGRMLSKYAPLLPDMTQVRRYVEPMVGGAAMLFSLQHPENIICDYNEELIDTYRVVKHRVDELIDILSGYVYDRDFFHEIRSWNVLELDDVTKAARMIYLNKTCYNGLYRVNKSGQFNAPFGTYKNPKIYCKDNLRNVSQFLKTTEILSGDFTVPAALIGENDFVYIDPPYIPLNATSNFTSYTAKGFSIQEQIRLGAFTAQLIAQGAKVMLSNSDTVLSREIFGHMQAHEVLSGRSINSNPNRRGNVHELVFTSYEV